MVLLKRLLMGLCCVGTVYGQSAIPVDSLYGYIKRQSAHRQSADWGTIDRLFQAKLAGARSSQDTMHCFVLVFERLNDVHSQLFLNNQFYGHYPRFHDTTLARLQPLNQRAMAATNQVLAKLLPAGIAYLRVPGMQPHGQLSVNALAQALYDTVAALAQRRPKGLILDLRLNGGGNVYPMLTGLSALLGNQVIGYETDVDDSVLRIWEIKNGNFVIGGYQATRLNVSRPADLTRLPVVVLLGPVTKSSGSMTAIAFKKRPRTIFMGEPTADGYTTSNYYVNLRPNLAVNLATNFVADRERQVYRTVVPPDRLLYGGDHFDELLTDRKVLAALQWLARAGGRR